MKTLLIMDTKAARGSCPAGIKALLMLFSGAIQALFRLYEGSIEL
jgi:hypothetical protein